MVETPLAFRFSKTRAICDAFDDAWAFLQARGSDFTEAAVPRFMTLVKALVTIQLTPGSNARA